MGEPKNARQIRVKIGFHSPYTKNLIDMRVITHDYLYNPLTSKKLAPRREELVRKVQPEHDRQAVKLCYILIFP